MAKKVVLSHEETMELVVEAQKGSEAAREKLVECNTRLIWSTVQRFKNRGYELEDLFQVGAIGFMKAISKFDMQFKVKFSTYAVPMIFGEIQRLIRDEGAIKVSRTTKEIANKIRVKELIKTPPEEIEKILVDYTLEQIKEAIGYIKNRIVSTDETVFSNNDGEDITLGDQLTGDVNGNNWIEHIELHNAVEQLEPRDQKIVELRFFRDYTQVETAKELGISQVQVSRLETKILQKMKTLMEDETMASYTLDQKREAIRLLEKTEMTYAQISKLTQVPTPTVGCWAKEHRDPKVTKANKRKGQLNTNKGKKGPAKNKKDKPIDTPVINEPAFMGDKDREALEKKNAAFYAIGTTSGRFQSDVPNKSIEPKTINEAIEEFREEIKKELREEVEAEVHMAMVQDQTEPEVIKVATVNEPPYKEFELQNEEAKDGSTNPKVTFNVEVSFGGKNVTKDQAVASLYEAYNLVKRLPTDNINLSIAVKN